MDPYQSRPSCNSVVDTKSDGEKAPEKRETARREPEESQKESQKREPRTPEEESRFRTGGGGGDDRGETEERKEDMLSKRIRGRPAESTRVPHTTVPALVDMATLAPHRQVGAHHCAHHTPPAQATSKARARSRFRPPQLIIYGHTPPACPTLSAIFALRLHRGWLYAGSFCRFLWSELSTSCQ